MTILFICTDNLDFAGSSKSLFNLINSLGNTVKPIVLFSCDGIVPQFLGERPSPIYLMAVAMHTVS